MRFLGGGRPVVAGLALAALALASCGGGTDDAVPPGTEAEAAGESAAGSDGQPAAAAVEAPAVEAPAVEAPAVEAPAVEAPAAEAAAVEAPTPAAEVEAGPGDGAGAMSRPEPGAEAEEWAKANPPQDPWIIEELGKPEMDRALDLLIELRDEADLAVARRIGETVAARRGLPLLEEVPVFLLRREDVGAFFFDDPGAEDAEETEFRRAAAGAAGGDRAGGVAGRPLP